MTEKLIERLAERLAALRSPERKKAMRVPRSLILAAVGLLAACRSYEAPIADQGDRQVVAPPLVVTASTPDSQLRVPESSPVIVSSDGRVSSAATLRRPAEVRVSEPVRRTGSPSVQREPSPAAPRVHRVREGDSLYSIAYEHDLDFRALALGNDLRAPYTIFVGQELVIDFAASTVAPTVTGQNSIGTAVRNNGVAQAQAGTLGRGGVSRRSIGASASAPNWRWPTETTRVLRGFGGSEARGIDIAVRRGDPVMAAADGEVVYAGRGVQGSGNLIILRHSDRYLSAYAHNSVMNVEEGARVRAGDRIAEAGTNLAGDPLLHFEIREDGKSIDPIGMLPAR